MNIPGTSAALGPISSVAVDPMGNAFIPLYYFNVVVRLDATTGILTLVAGTGISGFSGDNGPATGARLNEPSEIALDSAGNLYIADSGNRVIRKVSNGVITSVAGGGASTADDVPATNARLSYSEIAVDSAGNLFIGDGSRVRKVSNGIITTVAGNGTAGFSGDGGPATKAQLNGVFGLAVDAAGNLYISDELNHCIRKVSNGVITTVAGNGTRGFSGDGGPAIGAHLSYPWGLALDASGNLFIADQGNSRVRKVSNGIITTVAGNGTQGFRGDGGPATDAQFTNPAGVAVDSAGTLYFVSDSRVRKVSNGVITTVAGNGQTPPGALTFRSSSYSGVGSPIALAAGDFNGDGILDLITAGTDGTSNIYLLIGNGDGTFKLPAKAIDTGKTVFGPSRGGSSIAVGDVNRDGKLDVVVTVSPTGSPLGSVVLLTGRGDGTFNPPAFILPDRLQADYVALADVNGDGILDLVGAVGSSNTRGAVMVCLGKGDGTFTLFETEPIAGVQSQIVIADFNGDHLPDIAVNSPNGVISILLRKPATTFPMYQQAIQTTAGRTVTGADFAVADFNQDGFPDIVLPNHDPEGVTILLGKGDGTFRRNDIPIPVPPGTPEFYSYMSGVVAVADIDSDGKLDLVVDYGQYCGQNILVLFGKGDGSFQPPTKSLGSSQGCARQMIAGDFNGDGLPDLATASDGGIRIALNTTAVTPVITNDLSPLRAIVGVPFRYQIAATNNPTSYTVIGLPPGLVYDTTTGLISGTPTVAQIASLKISASNSAGTSAVVTVSMTVNPPVPAVTALVNAASNLAALAPGALATVYGTNFTAPAPVFNNVLATLPTNNAGASFGVSGGRNGAAGFNFATPATSDFVFVGGAATLYSLTAAKDVTVGLYADAGGTPGALLESLRLGTVATSPGVIAFSSAVYPILTAGRQYWLAVSVPNGTTSSGVWLWPPAPDRGLEAISTDGGPWVVNNQNRAAFQVFGYAKAGNTPLPTTLGGVSLTVGGYAAPLLYVGSGQINFQVPYEVLGTASLVVNANGVASIAAKVTVGDAGPGVFVYGNRWAIVQNQDYSLNGPSNPAKVGSYITLYGTGGGPVSPVVGTGNAAPVSPLSETTRSVTATINGAPATVTFAGLTPGAVGLLQVNIQVPGLPPGTYAIQITEGGIKSNAASIAVAQ